MSKSSSKKEDFHLWDKMEFPLKLTIKKNKNKPKKQHTKRPHPTTNKNTKQTLAIRTSWLLIYIIRWKYKVFLLRKTWRIVASAWMIASWICLWCTLVLYLDVSLSLLSLGIRISGEAESEINNLLTFLSFKVLDTLEFMAKAGQLSLCTRSAAEASLIHPSSHWER